MRVSRPILIVLLVLSALESAWGQTTWYVDDDCIPPGTGSELNPFCTIQQGIDASQDGDTVLVQPGLYTGVGNRDISLFGKLIALRSNGGPAVTIIDSEGSPASIHRGFFLDHGETRGTTVEGFTITGGYLIGNTGGSGPSGGGGGAGIYLGASSPTIRDCVVVGNISRTVWNPFVHDGWGGGILLDRESSALIENCVIIDNEADRHGGGMLHIGGEETSAAVRNCLFALNSAEQGGGIHSAGGIATFINTTVVGNTAVFGGGFKNEQSQGLISNCVIWGNQAEVGQEIVVQGPIVTVQYSIVQGGLADIFGFSNPEIVWGPGNIDADPLFVDGENGIFRLLHGSPCIDAGDNLAVAEGVTTDLDGDPRFLDDPTAPDTGNPDPDAPKLPIVDMGPYEYDPDDCNNNDIPDADDIDNETSIDCDENAIPDDCELDCNDNGQVDACDVTQGSSDDCNGNLIPDECELDCNDNGQQDDCDITDGSSDDCDTNGVPDECDPDCNDNGEVDACDIADGFSNDCDGDNIPDECDPGPPILDHPADQEVEAGDFVFFNVQADGALLEYQWRKDGVDLVDNERIIGSAAATLLILDVRPLDAAAYDCVITDLFGPICTTTDVGNLTVITDCPADFDDNGAVGPFDLAILLGNWGPNAGHPADLDADGTVGPSDLALLLGNWGPCPPP